MPHRMQVRPDVAAGAHGRNHRQTADACGAEGEQRWRGSNFAESFLGGASGECLDIMPAHAHYLQVIDSELTACVRSVCYPVRDAGAY